MSGEVYACIHAAEFPVQALLRLRPELRAEPVAVLDGRAPLESVCSINMQARKRGAVLHMTRTEAETIVGLRLLPRSMEGEASARSVLLECATNFSPRIEDVSKGTACRCVLDIAGTERLFGPPETAIQRIRAVLTSIGFHAAIAVSANFHTARIKAASARAIAVIPAGEEADALAPLPIAVLDLPDEYAETLALWGIRTLREFAALQEIEIVTWLGHDATVWHDLALGVYPHTFQPIEPDFHLEEFCEFETPVEHIESLLFICARMIDCLVERASMRAMSLASLTIHLKVEGGQVHRRIIRPALPSIERKFLLKLVQLEVAAHPPQAAVIALTLSAEAGQSSNVQLGLFAPQTPEPSRLDVTLARLKAIVGEDRVGSPVLEDTHRTDCFSMEGFAIGARGSTPQIKYPRLALRRMRPPVPVRVVLRTERPVAFHDPRNSYEIEVAYGPWRSSGCWWSADGWNTEEWDVLAIDRSGVSIACLLVCNRTRSKWHLEAFYD